jgi:UDP-N-acetylmuramyl pentapeptide phosphotransferase/UDP-N-acetylglucosamine-1-phosphate transferase
MELYWILQIVAAFAVCVIVTGILIPQILLISFRRNLFDEPDERKIHKNKVPRLGGIAFMPAIFVAVALLSGVDAVFGWNKLIADMGQNNVTLLFGFAAITTIYLVGEADDLVGVRYRAKFAMQIICSLMLIAGGLWVDNFHGFLGLYEIPAWIGIPFTVLIVLFIINAVNLIDGIDGLASGLTACAMFIYGYVLFRMETYTFAILAFATLGVLVPFFYFNVFGSAEKQHKIFMGDTGSLTVGLIISMLALRLVNVGSSFSGHAYDGNVLVVAVAPLLIPCFDVVRVYLGRVRRGKNPFLPDKTHIHHKLLAAGMSQRKAMVSIVVASVTISSLFIVLSKSVNVNILIAAGAVLFIVFNVALSHFIDRRKAKSVAAA